MLSCLEQAWPGRARIARSFALAALLLIALRASVGGELVTNLAAVADTGLYEISPTNNLGAITEIPAGVHSNGKRSRYLLRFQPETAVPTGALITSAELQLRITTANSGTADFGLHRLMHAWTEGTNGGANGSPASIGETTWLARSHPDEEWAAPGGLAGTDYETNASVSATFVGGNTNTSLSSPGLVADIQRWLNDPGTNFGWMLRAVDESVVFSGRRIASRELATNAPRLFVRYRVSPRLRVNSFTNGVLTLAFDAETNRTYTVESRTTLDRSAWETCTNYPLHFVPVVLIFSEAAAGVSCFYRVREQ